MKIKANNIEDFEKEYFSTANKEDILLSTNDIFWKYLTDKVIKQQLNVIEYTALLLSNNKSFTTIYHQKYGYITRNLLE